MLTKNFSEGLGMAVELHGNVMDVPTEQLTNSSGDDVITGGAI